jgi:hypothetical protein
MPSGPGSYITKNNLWQPIILNGHIIAFELIFGIYVRISLITLGLDMPVFPRY